MGSSETILALAPAPQTRLPDWPTQHLKGNRLSGDRYTSREFFALAWEQLCSGARLLLGPTFGLGNPDDPRSFGLSFGWEN